MDVDSKIKRLEAMTTDELIDEVPQHHSLPVKYRGGDWWHNNEPGCGPIGCCGHSSFRGALISQILADLEG